MFAKGNKLGEKHKRVCHHGVLGASTCKECRREIARRYHQKHREELLPAMRERGKIWFQNNKERHRENGRKWKKNNPERARELGRRSKRRLSGTLDAHGETKFGPCEICQKVLQLHFDHNHDTGNFRGWLCYECNPRFEWALNNMVRIQAYIQINHQQSQQKESQICLSTNCTQQTKTAMNTPPLITGIASEKNISITAILDQNSFLTGQQEKTL